MPNKRLTTDEFIKRAKKIHGKKYDYSKAIYKNTKKKIMKVLFKIIGEN